MRFFDVFELAHLRKTIISLYPTRGSLSKTIYPSRGVNIAGYASIKLNSRIYVQSNITISKIVNLLKLYIGKMDGVKYSVNVQQ